MKVRPPPAEMVYVTVFFDDVVLCGCSANVSGLGEPTAFTELCCRMTRSQSEAELSWLSPAR